MNPIVKFFLTSGLRHLFTIICTLFVVKHWVGADIAKKLALGDTVTLWDGYSLSISSMVDYTLLALVPTLLPVLISVWTRIKAKYKIMSALSLGTPSQVTAAIQSTPTTEIIKTVSASPNI